MPVLYCTVLYCIMSPDPAGGRHAPWSVPRPLHRLLPVPQHHHRGHGLLLLGRNIAGVSASIITSNQSPHPRESPIDGTIELEHGHVVGQGVVQVGLGVELDTGHAHPHLGEILLNINTKYNIALLLKSAYCKSPCRLGRLGSSPPASPPSCSPAVCSPAPCAPQSPEIRYFLNVKNIVACI